MAHDIRIAVRCHVGDRGASRHAAGINQLARLTMNGTESVTSSNMD
jgi:hypothetical protein